MTKRELTMTERADLLEAPEAGKPYGDDRWLLCTCWPRKNGGCDACKLRIGRRP